VEAHIPIWDCAILHQQSLEFIEIYGRLVVYSP
jgi:hypothetical protein